MKRYLFVAGILFVITSLIACGSMPNRIVQDIEPEATPEHIVRDIEPEATPEHIVQDIEPEAASEHITGEIEPETTPNHIAEDSEPEKGAEDSVQHSIFGKVLWDVYRTGMLPEGNSLDGYDMESVQENSYAIFDADGDGQDELLLLWENASMAGMTGCVYGCDGETVYKELSAFPALRFYENGIVEEDFSHNQNLAGDFWPYFVYQYDSENKTYRLIGGVDAWDKRIREENSEGDIFPVHFPADIDADGDGIVYFLLPADWDGYYNNVPMVDGADYESWRSFYLNGAAELKVPLQKLTEKNISELESAD